MVVLELCGVGVVWCWSCMVLKLCDVEVVLCMCMCCGCHVLVIWMRCGCCVHCVLVFHVFIIGDNIIKKKIRKGKCNTNNSLYRATELSRMTTPLENIISILLPGTKIR